MQPDLLPSSTARPWYQRGYRRMLIDMHIADWEKRLLGAYDPAHVADLYVQAHLTSVMFYCQSHVGLCYYPTRTGNMHAGLCGRDVVGEMLSLLHDRGLACCAYYSVVYNNWAFLEHPEWRMIPAGDISDGSFAGHRYGHCCPNNPGYREFALAQTEEILSAYAFDGFFFDMTFWPAICLCEHCRQRFREEHGAEIPTTIDWLSPTWCAFQSARERWMGEFAAALSGQVKAVRPDTSVYHNFATALFNWTLGLSCETAVHHDFLGADFYGDALEQLMVSKFMYNLTEHRPLEFMTSCCVNLRDHVRLKSEAEMEMQAFAATLFGSPFVFIDAINLDGTVHEPTAARVGDIYTRTAPYEPFLGGEEVADIAIYFSSESKMDFAENGRPIEQAPMWSNVYPHSTAVRGCCRVLQQAHLPFTIITRKQLDRLSDYRAVMLPNVLRMDAEEVAAFRAYVSNGGRLYASRYTSLTDTQGTRFADFQLADLFGCHFQDDDLGAINYLRPATAAMAAGIAPQSYVSQFPLAGHLAHARTTSAGTLRLCPDAEGETLAHLTLPYASPHGGTVHDRHWASIHSSPPWQDTAHPVIVRHPYGDGLVIYAAADIESVDSDVNTRLMRLLLAELLPERPRYGAETHPAVWMNVFQQADAGALLVNFLNCQAQLPAIPIGRLPFSLVPPAGNTFTRLLALPDETPVPFDLDAQGVLHADAGPLEVFRMLRAEYR
jgi:hypothetical protein